MAKDNSETTEKEIWELYLKKCQKDGTTPSVKDFTEWTKTLLKQL